MNDELTKLRRAVEATEMIAMGLRDAIVTRISYTVFGSQPTDSERYLLTIAEQQVQLARAAYREAYVRWLDSKDDGADICTCP